MTGMTIGNTYTTIKIDSTNYRLLYFTTYKFLALNMFVLRVNFGVTGCGCGYSIRTKILKFENGTAEP